MPQKPNPPTALSPDRRLWRQRPPLATASNWARAGLSIDKMADSDLKATLAHAPRPSLCVRCFPFGNAGAPMPVSRAHFEANKAAARWGRAFLIAT